MAQSRALQRNAPGDNASCPWDEFDPEWYVEHNYRTLRDDDRRIIDWVQRFFAEVADPKRPVLRAIDVGSGANLYPALSMLPYCQEIELRERGAQNVKWLTQEIQNYSDLWDQYWDVLTAEPYRQIAHPRQAVKERVRARPGNLFDLGTGRWDMGTMFFVAESLTDRPREFQDAVGKFVGALKRNAPFAVAFMRGSTGYKVNKVRFPAVAVSRVDVEYCLEQIASEVQIKEISSDQWLRDGYKGMILAVGRAGKPKVR